MKSRLQLTAAAAAAGLAATPLASAQDACSCSPTAYNFTLNTDGSCDTSYVTGYSNAGVEGSICFFTAGGDPDEIDKDNIEFGGPTRERELRQVRKRFSHGVGPQWRRVLNEVDLSSHVDHAEKRLLAQQQNNLSSRKLQYSRQELDTVPVTITSVTFLEADTSPQLNIVNQDSTYFETDLSNGDIMTFNSISAGLDPDVPLEDQMDMVAGGVMVILFGVNADGMVVQNTVAWGYKTDYCIGEPLVNGDAIGWIGLEGFEPPVSEFCTAVTDEPTPTPSASPIAATTTTAATEATAAMSIRMSASKSAKSTGHMFSKSAKSDHKADTKADKMSMPFAKATKVFKMKAKGSKSEEPSAKSGKEKSTKGESEKHVDAKADKLGDSKSGKEDGMLMDPFGKAAKDSQPKAGKEKSSGGKSSTGKGTSKGKGKGVMSIMSMDFSKAEKPKADAKAGKGYDEASGKGMSKEDGMAKVPSAKAEKTLDPKAVKKEPSTKSEKGMPKYKGFKTDMSMKGSKAEKGFGTDMSMKSGKAEKSIEKMTKTTKGPGASGKADKMSMDTTSFTSAKAEKMPDAKAGKESPPKGGSMLEGKALKSDMSMPKDAKSSKSDSSKSGKAKTSKEDVKSEAKAEKESSPGNSAKAMKADPVSTSTGYREIVDGLPE